MTWTSWQCHISGSPEHISIEEADCSYSGKSQQSWNTQKLKPQFRELQWWRRGCVHLLHITGSSHEAATLDTHGGGEMEAMCKWLGSRSCDTAFLSCAHAATLVIVWRGKADVCHSEDYFILNPDPQAYWFKGKLCKIEPEYLIPTSIFLVFHDVAVHVSCDYFMMWWTCSCWIGWCLRRKTSTSQFIEQLTYNTATDHSSKQKQRSRN